MSAPSLKEIQECLQDFDGSGTGILSVRQCKGALRDLENLPFSKDEIEEHIELAKDVAGDGNGKIKLEPFAMYLAFEVRKKQKSTQKTQPKQKQPQNDENVNPFLDFGDFNGNNNNNNNNNTKQYNVQVTKSPQDTDDPLTGKSLDLKKQNLISPTAATDLPDWFGHSIDSPLNISGSQSLVNNSTDDFLNGLLGSPNEAPKKNNLGVGNNNNNTNKNRSKKRSPKTSNYEPSNSNSSMSLPAPRRKGQSPRNGNKKKSPRSKKAKSPGPVTSFSFATHFDNESEIDEVFTPRKDYHSQEQEVKVNDPPLNKKSSDKSNNSEKSDENTKNEKKKEDKRKKKRRKRTDAVAEMKRGTAMLKYGRRGFPHFRRFQLSKDNSKLIWYSRKKSINETNVEIKNIKDVLEGQQTEVFRQCTQRTLEKASFSIVYGEKLKTLDLVAKSFEEAQLWVKGLKGLMRANRQGKLHKVAQILVDVNFTDISKPNYRDKSVDVKPGQGYNNVELLRTVETTLEQSKKTFKSLSELAQQDVIVKSEDYENISTLVSEIEERLEEMDFALNHKSMSLANLKRDVWVLKVDVTVLEEKLKVIAKAGRKLF